MIQPLRTVHRRIFVALALVLPAILLVGIGARHPRQRVSVPAAQLPASAYLVKKSENLWQKHTILSKFYAAPNHPEQIYVVLEPAQDLGEPDLLLYWTTNEPQGNTLPAQARLLGAFASNRAFALPQDDVAHAGHLVLYSLAHQVASDSATLEKLP